MTAKRRLIYQLNAARHAMMKSMNARCRDELGVSVSQLTALMMIARQPRCQMTDLADTLMLDKSAITRLSRRLCDGGLVAKRTSPEDSRVSHLSLTPTGRAVLDASEPLLRDGNRRMAGTFSNAELTVVSRYLDHITTTFTDGN